MIVNNYVKIQESRFMMGKKKQGIFAYIDVENVRGCLRKASSKKLNYFKLYNWLKKIGVTRAYLYAGVYEDDAKEAQKYKDLEKLGYRVHTKVVQRYPQEDVVVKATCPSCKNKFDTTIKRHSKSKANCDATMTLDIINDGVRRRYKEIIVFSADGDFADVYEYVSKSIKRKVTVFAPLGRYKNMTSTKIKKLDELGAVNLLNLISLIETYGEPLGDEAVPSVAISEN